MAGGQALTAQEREQVIRYLRWWGDPEALGLTIHFPEEYGQQEEVAWRLSQQTGQMPVSPDTGQNRTMLRLLLGSSPDVTFRHVELGQDRRPAVLAGIAQLFKPESLMTLLESLVVEFRNERLPADPAELVQTLEHRVLVSTKVVVHQTLAPVIHQMLAGDVLLFVEGIPVAFELAVQGFEHRKPSEPVAEPVVRGPKEGFTETLAINLALVRRRLKDERFRTERFTVGERSRTTVYIVYLGGLAVPALVEEVRSRVGRIQIDGVMESGYIEEFIEDTTLTPFPLVMQTERPDVVCAQLVEGRIAILVDGTPHALIVPYTFNSGMQAAEDYYERWMWTSFVRLLRYIYLFVALIGPSTYIAIVTFHHEMLPTDLLLSLMIAREGVPFPAVVEAFLMEMAFEVLREAGLRLPKPVGQSVSIVGGLVIGQAAVQAGIVSPAMVIVVSITGISSFIIPKFSLAVAIRMLRFPMMVAAGMFGFYGVALALLAISIHLAGLRSFGVPYMSPSMPPTADDLKDMMIRAPWWFMRRRPKFMPVFDRQRVSAHQQPGPDK